MSTPSPAPRAPLAQVIDELQPLVGARIQKVDVIALREVVLELRVPGRTLRLLLSARPSLGRVALVRRRPPRLVEPGQLQSILRARLLGQALVDLRLEEGVVHLVTRRAEVRVRTEGGKAAFAILEPRESIPETLPVRTIPDHFPLAEASGADYEVEAPRQRTAALRRAIGRSLRARRRKLSRLRSRVLGDERRLASFEDAGRDGELLKTVLHEVRRGQHEVEVMDWAEETLRKIRLDPALTPRANLERIFSRSKKARRGLPKVRARLADVEARLATVEDKLAELEAADADALDALSRAWQSDDGPSSRSGDKASKPRAHRLDKWSRRFEAKDGSVIRVGKGAAANDRLTFTGAKGSDVWLHARGVTGAHVILYASKGRAPHPEALLDAAHLAVHFSSAKNEAKAEVIHTEARHVKKTKGAPAGQVGISKSKTLLVRMEQPRLDRLLGREVT